MRKLKITLSLFLLMMLLFNLAACERDVFTIYKQAEAKTKSIKTGRQKISLSFTNEADMVKLECLLRNGKTPDTEATELYKDLNSFKDMKFEYTKQYDTTQDKYISDGFIRFNIYNLEGKLYKDRDNYIIERLQIPKYIRFTSEEFTRQFFKQYDFQGQKISFNNDVTAVLANIVEEHIIKGSIMSNGRKIIDTPEGDIKVKELKISLEGEKLIALKNELLHAIRQNTLIFSELASDKTADKKVKEMLITGIRQLEPLSMEYTVYIDANGYIMEKNIYLKSKLYYPQANMDVIKIWSYSSQYWDLDKKQVIQVPQGIDMEAYIDIKTFLEQLNDIKL